MNKLCDCECCWGFLTFLLSRGEASQRLAIPHFCPIARLEDSGIDGDTRKAHFLQKLMNILRDKRKRGWGQQKSPDQKCRFSCRRWRSSASILRTRLDSYEKADNLCQSVHTVTATTLRDREAKADASKQLSTHFHAQGRTQVWDIRGRAGS